MRGNERPSRAAHVNEALALRGQLQRCLDGATAVVAAYNHVLDLRREGPDERGSTARSYGTGVGTVARRALQSYHVDFSFPLVPSSSGLPQRLLVRPVCSCASP